jgi:hypothetical protein
MVVTSADGETWTTRDSGTREILGKVRHVGGLWIAVGRNGALLTSPNGATWTKRDTHTTKELFDIGHANGVWVAVGYSATILTSKDGTNWAPRDSGIRRLLQKPSAPKGFQALSATPSNAVPSAPQGLRILAVRGSR